MRTDINVSDITVAISMEAPIDLKVIQVDDIDITQNLFKKAQFRLTLFQDVYINIKVISVLISR